MGNGTSWAGSSRSRACVAVMAVVLLTALTPTTSRAQATTRDPISWPFPWDSIWNMPLGDRANYVPAGIEPGRAFGVFADEDILILEPDARQIDVISHDADWDPARDRCDSVVRPTDVHIADVPVPDWFTTEVDNEGTPNSSAAILLADRRTVVQTQPLHVCGPGGQVVSQYRFPDDDIVSGSGRAGAHGGASMSSIGGTIRVGEVVPGGQIRHALKVVIDSSQYTWYDASDATPGYRWPAFTADAGAEFGYGGSNPAVEMGSLLALRPDFDLASLRTEPARIIARALMNYGSYVVDSSGWDTHYFATEFGPNGRVINDFEADWGFPWMTEQTATCGNAADRSCAWSMDMGDIFSSLHAVTNNSASNIGGPGNRLAPCAPAFGDGTGGAPASCGTSSAGPPVAPPTPVPTAAASGELAFGGTIHGYNDNWNTGAYLQTAEEHFNAVTATAYMPWGGWTERADGPQTYGVDRVVQWARPASGERSLRVHGHTLVYPLANAQLPWYRDLPDGQHEAVLEQYVTEIAGSNAGNIWVWDVVNEVMADEGQSQDGWGVRNDSIEYLSIGSDFVDKAFRWADAADPNALLIVNDYGAEEINDKSDRLFEYVTELRSRGVPIDGVGFQMHLWASRGPTDFISIRNNFERFTNAGFKVYITELDVPIVENFDQTAPTAAELEQQRAVYEEVARIATEVDGVESLFMWDFVDNRSWLHPVRNDSMEPFVDEGTYTFPTPFTGGLGEPVEAKVTYQGLVEGLNEAPLVAWSGVNRLRSGWEPTTGYLTRTGDPDGSGGYTPGESLELHPLTTETEDWSSMHWVAEPAQWGFVRIRSDWEGGSGYLTRRGDDDGQGGFVPGRAIDLGALDRTYSSQLWRLEPAGNGQVRIVSAWEPGTGVISRDSLPDDSQAPSNQVSLLAHNPAWTSQLWNFAPLNPASTAFCLGRVVTIDLNNANPAQPTNGNDVILGTPGNDTINALGGDDIICGGAGNDTIDGGLGVDRILGEAGNDTLYGSGGSDVIYAAAGNDTVWAGSGADYVFGGPGDDELNGMGGQDRMYGGDGRDVMQGSWQSDRLFGGPGDDVIRGGRGKDIIYGEAGDDALYGGVNTDYLDGGAGTDTADGQQGKDNPLVPGVSGCVAEQLTSC